MRADRDGLDGEFVGITGGRLGISLWTGKVSKISMDHGVAALREFPAQLKLKRVPGKIVDNYLHEVSPE